MSELDNDDVVFAEDPNLLLVGTTTFKVRQLKQVLSKHLMTLTNNSQAGIYWLEQGIGCEVLRANSGGGWKKGKIRLHLEIVVDEPEPKPESTEPDSIVP